MHAITQAAAVKAVPPRPMPAPSVEDLPSLSLPEAWERWKVARAEFERVGRLIGELVDPYPPDLKALDRRATRAINDADRAIIRARALTVEDVNAKLQWLAYNEKMGAYPPTGFVTRLARDMAKIMSERP